MKYLNTDTGELIDFEFKTPYNHNTSAESLRCATTNEEPTKTQQHPKDECDINTIVRNFGITKQLPNVPVPPSLEDFTEVFDFQTAMNVMAEAKASFMALPADIRSAFNNDPHNFVHEVDAILGDTDIERRDRNMASLRAMGLMLPPGPVADKTTLGDLLAAIKERATVTPEDPPKTA